MKEKLLHIKSRLPCFIIPCQTQLKEYMLIIVR